MTVMRGLEDPNEVVTVRVFDGCWSRRVPARPPWAIRSAFPLVGTR